MSQSRQKHPYRKLLPKQQTLAANVQVCECVVILKNLKDVSWAGAKSMMADTGFLKGLVEFDKDSLSEKQVPSRLTDCLVPSVCPGLSCQIMQRDQARQVHAVLFTPLHHRHTACSNRGSTQQSKMHRWQCVAVNNVAGEKGA